MNADQIYNLWVERQTGLAKVHQAGHKLKSVYEGTHQVILPEIDRNESSAVANLVQSGLDQHSMRIASVIPNIICPPTKPTKQAIKKANQRRLALQAWWYQSKMPLKLRLRARHLIGYAFSPVLIRPGIDGFPVWEVKNPLESFPAPCSPDDIVPSDCIFAFRRSARWLMTNYPDAGTIVDREKPDAQIDVLQYVSADQFSLVAVGRRDTSNTPTMMLADVPNKAGRPCVIAPGRITLDALQGQFDQLIGMHEMQAKLWALQIHAVQREIFGETWITSGPNGGPPNVVQEADPYDGTVGIVEDGQITQFRVSSSQGPNQAIDRLEANQRINGAVPAEMGGQSGSNIRTGRRGSQVFAAAVDMPVQEHQELLAWSLEEENKAAIAVAKGYWGNTPKTFQIPFGKGQVTYTPEQTFDTDEHHVNYAYAGTDTNGLVIEGGQRVSMGTLSKRSFMGIDPMVTDPDTEHDSIIKEGLEAAFLQSIQTQAAQPDGPWQPLDLARLTELVYTQDIELYEAVQTVHMEAQQRQADQQQAQQTAGAPGGAPMGAEQQPGLGMAGAPGTPQASIAGPNPSQTNLVDLLNSLRRPQSGPQGTGLHLAPQAGG